MAGLPYTGRQVPKRVLGGRLFSVCGASYSKMRLGPIGNGFASAMVGGVASQLGGGKFENGAITSAFHYMYNCALHECLLNYVRGNKTNLDARFEELGASDVKPEMFPKFNSLVSDKLSDGAYPVNDQIGWQTRSLNARAAYGRVTLKLDGVITVSGRNYTFEGKLSALPDVYDFDPRPWGERTIPAEISTRVGATLPGEPFKNVFIGNQSLTNSGTLR